MPLLLAAHPDSGCGHEGWPSGGLSFLPCPPLSPAVSSCDSHVTESCGHVISHSGRGLEEELGDLQ